MDKEREVLLKKKWQKFLKLRLLFNLVPFLDFVLAAGSLALGSAREDSDFDVIVGCRENHIFTVRFFCFLTFGFFGVRRKRTDFGPAAKDKICFSHFVTPQGYKLEPPYNDYWKKMYQSLVPVFGKKKFITDFFKANEWASILEIKPDNRFRKQSFNLIRKKLELFFGFRQFENFIKKIQIRRIEKHLQSHAPGKESRIIYKDRVIEFHVLNKNLKSNI